MKVSEIAKEFNTTNKIVLEKLKALKLKAKSGTQELNNTVVVVLRSELRKGLSSAMKTEGPPKAGGKSVSAGEEIKEGKAKKEKKEVAKAEAKAKVIKPKPKREEKEKKPVTKRIAKKAVEKKKIPKEKAPPEIKTPEGAAEKPKKAKPAISAEPFIPLKPLAKKKRKGMTRGKEDVPGIKGTQGSSLTTLGKEPGSGAALQAPQEGEPQEPIIEEDLSHLKGLELKIPISVKDFAFSIQQKTGEVLKKLIQMRVFANINQHLDGDIVKRLAREFGYNLVKVKTQEQQVIETHQVEEGNPKLLKPRAPVVTFMGHVDHGKTSLLDRVRKSRVADREHGGITQHIGASSVQLPKGRITFLDTPGHEAFTAMRARGAHITDLVVVVIAADEGIMPQTEEAIDHARAADVPIVVAINKIDRKNADVDRVKKQLDDHNLKPEDWGGKTIIANVSATTGEGVDNLLDMILLEAEMLELKANSQKMASGIVVEAHLSRGKGAVASLIVQSGTLNVNDILVVGPYYCKVKAMFDDIEKPIEKAVPSTPVEILGLPGVPEAGEIFYVVKDEKQAKEITFVRQEQLKKKKRESVRKITLEDLYSQIQEGKIKELNVILKADVQGSLEALKDSLEKIPSEEVKVKFIHTGVGEVNASDVILAVASNAIIIAFHVGIGSRAKVELEKNPIDVRQYRIIYDAVNEVRKALEGLLDPHHKKKFLSRIEVREVFKLSKSGIIAGCYVTKGKVQRKAQIDVVRNGEVVFSGTISSLKRFKDDVRDVAEGYECGISIDGFDKIQAGDVLEAYEIETIVRTL